MQSPLVGNHLPCTPASGRGLQVPYGVLSDRSSGVQTLGLGQFLIDSPDKYVFKNEEMPKQGCKKEVCYIVNGYIM